MRVRDRSVMAALWELASLFHHYFLVWVYSLTSFLRSGENIFNVEIFTATIEVGSSMCELLWSEGYCYFLDFIQISYYLVTNRFNRPHSGQRFLPVAYTTIDEVGLNEA